METIQTLAPIAEHLATTLALVIGGVWALRKSLETREGHPKIEFGVDLLELGDQQGHTLLELSATVLNKGLVRHKIKDFKFDLYYLRAESNVEVSEALNGQVRFERALKDRVWLPLQDNDYTFVDPGIVQKYVYLASVPSEAAFVLLKSRFEYPDAESDFHSAQKAIRLVGQRSASQGTVGGNSLRKTPETGTA